MTAKALILNQIKSHYGFRKDAEFAGFLGITPQTLSNWKARDTFDTFLVYTKCVDVNPHWILTGEGEMLKKNEHTPIGSTGLSGDLLVNRSSIPPYKVGESKPNFEKNVSPTVSPTLENCKDCDQRERIIEQQQTAIDALHKLVAQLEVRIEQLGVAEKKQAG